MTEINNQIEKLFVKGTSIDQIALLTGGSATAVRKQIRKIIQNWKKRLFAEQCDFVAMELGKINCLETEYWKLIEMYNSARKPDPKLLQGVERCVEMRLRLLNIDTTNDNTNKKQQQDQKNIKIDLTKLSNQTLAELSNIYQKERQKIE